MTRLGRPMLKPFVANSVEKAGDKSLRITLKRQDAVFLVGSLSKLNLAPKHVRQPIFDDLATKPQTAESVMEPRPVGSVPFKMVSVNLNEQIVLAANLHH